MRIDLAQALHPGALSPVGKSERFIPAETGSTTTDRGRKLINIPGERPFSLYEADLSEQARNELSKLGDATQRIEGIFVKDLMKVMLPKGFGGEGPMGDFARENFMNALADVAGKNGSFGVATMFREKLAETIYRQEAARLMARPTRTENQP